ncbi:MAG: RsiV family protein [Bacteroidota bacterium]|nr:RsiV family protein [Bacteroidota bacterium]
MKNLLLIFIISSIILPCANSQTMNITYKTITDKNPDYSINATYPQIDFGPEALMGVRGIAQDINNALDTMVSQIINGFVNEVSRLPDKIVNGNGSSLGITSEAYVSNGTLLSAHITDFSSIAGAAHPLTTIHSFNYSIIASGILNITNLFLSNSDYLNYISNYCITQLREYAQKEGYTNIDEMITGGASPELKNFNTWSIKNDNLEIKFNPYQVAPYVFGIQTVSIPLSNMTSMLNPKGPLSFMFR